MPGVADEGGGSSLPGRWGGTTGAGCRRGSLPAGRRTERLPRWPPVVTPAAATRRGHPCLPGWRRRHTLHLPALCLLCLPRWRRLPRWRVGSGLQCRHSGRGHWRLRRHLLHWAPRQEWPCPARRRQQRLQACGRLVEGVAGQPLVAAAQRHAQVGGAELHLRQGLGFSHRKKERTKERRGLCWGWGGRGSGWAMAQGCSATPPRTRDPTAATCTRGPAARGPAEVGASPLPCRALPAARSPPAGFPSPPPHLCPPGLEEQQAVQDAVVVAAALPPQQLVLPAGTSQGQADAV